MMRLLTALCLAAAALSWPVRTRAANVTYRVDPASSHLTISVGKAGAFSFVAGHTHQVIAPIERGTVEFDRDDPSRSRVQIVVATSEFAISPKGEPPDDVPKILQTMRSDKVLDIARYPRLSFQSTGVGVKSARGTTLELVVAGRLTIRDVTRPVTVLVHSELGANAINARAKFSIRQRDFGITPVSVAGLVAVKDALDIAFSMIAVH